MPSKLVPENVLVPNLETEGDEDHFGLGNGAAVKPRLQEVPARFGLLGNGVGREAQAQFHHIQVKRLLGLIISHGGLLTRSGQTNGVNDIPKKQTVPTSHHSTTHDTTTEKVGKTCVGNRGRHHKGRHAPTPTTTIRSIPRHQRPISPQHTSQRLIYNINKVNKEHPRLCCRPLQWKKEDRAARTQSS